ncbi:MAG: HD domain-containing phosphohydrolase [Thermodesulfobacteriota bacterium]
MSLQASLRNMHDISEETVRILVVDDEELIRNLFNKTFNLLGYQCDTVDNGFSCIEKIKTGEIFDLVLLDVQMPKINGIDTLKNLKLISPDLSIVMVSGSREGEHIKEALKEGAYDYVFKPFDVEELKNVIERAIERSKLIKQNKDYQMNLEGKVVEQTKELINLYADTLEAMVLALDLREKETGFHSYRVTEYALTLARSMQLSDYELSTIAKGALLHDIGKIGVPDNILLKPQHLTQQEWIIMKKHPVLGFELLRKIEFLEDASKLVLHHHEHYNGEGYPSGISGKNIPLGARIFTIVDALDALTSNRVYRSSGTFEEARDIIIEQSGKQFDPEIIEHFSMIHPDEFKKIRKQFEENGADYLRNLFFRMKNN